MENSLNLSELWVPRFWNENNNINTSFAELLWELHKLIYAEPMSCLYVVSFQRIVIFIVVVAVSICFIWIVQLD